MELNKYFLNKFKSMDILKDLTYLEIPSLNKYSYIDKILIHSVKTQLSGDSSIQLNWSIFPIHFNNNINIYVNNINKYSTSDSGDLILTYVVHLNDKLCNDIKKYNFNNNFDSNIKKINIHLIFKNYIFKCLCEFEEIQDILNHLYIFDKYYDDILPLILFFMIDDKNKSDIILSELNFKNIVNMFDKNQFDINLIDNSDEMKININNLLERIYLIKKIINKKKCYILNFNCRCKELSIDNYGNLKFFDTYIDFPNDILNSSIEYMNKIYTNNIMINKLAYIVTFLITSKKINKFLNGIDKKIAVELDV